MTTVSGSTTSSQGTQKTVNLNEAPFNEYLKILRKEGFDDDADISEEFYVGMLTSFGYTEEQIMKTPFNKLGQAVELIMSQSEQELTAARPVSVSGTMMTGEGADSLTPEQLQYLMQRQVQLTEEEKLRLSM